MPKIMLNSVEYTGGGGDNGMELTYDEYLALPEEEKTNGTTYYVKDINGAGKDQFQPIIYSEEEREIGVWTDGKPLYEKTISSSDSLTKGAWVAVYTNSNTDVKYYKGVVIIDQNGSFVDFDYYRGSISTSEYCVSMYHKTNNSVQVWQNIATTTYGYHLTIQYTKNEDTPGSGTWTPQGVPAVHYDGDEKVIGTWFGETLYEKSFQFTNSSTGTIRIPISISFNEVISVDGAIHRSDDRWFSTNYAADSFGWAINVGNILSNQITIECGSNLSGQYLIDKGYITIRYTKTTS